MRTHESSPQPAKSSSRLEDYATDPVIMHEAERLLSGRTRDIRLAGALGQAFLDRSWRQNAKIIRSWMVWVIMLDALTLAMNLFLLPRETAVSMLPPGAIIPAAASAVYLTWRSRHSHWLLNSSLTIGMLLVLLSVCLMGMAAGGSWQERYLYVMVFVAIAGITTFSVSMRYIWSIAAGCLGFYLIFQLLNPVIGPAEAASTFFFFACGITAVVFARRTMTILAGKAFLLELRDASRLAALTEANERLDHLSKIDPLTGLANRRRMTELLTALANHPPHLRGDTAILMCDMDCFKSLNDTLGHAEGDRCLAAVAAIIDGSVRSGSDHVARYGGEEFLVILPETSADEALVIAERIRSAVFQARLANPGSRVAPVVTVSIGVTARHGAEHWTPDELQWEADRALYQAKEAGRNRVKLWSGRTLAMQGGNNRTCGDGVRDEGPRSAAAL